MDWMYLFYFLLAALICFGARYAGRGNWNEEYTSLKQMKILQGITALGIVLHHMAQRTCAPWLPSVYIRHGLDSFVPIGYMLVGVFLFCSGFGLYTSVKTKPDYLKGFFRGRILPVILAFYLSEWIYTAIRLISGVKMDFMEILWYLSGLHMANGDAWYGFSTWCSGWLSASANGREQPSSGCSFLPWAILCSVPVSGIRVTGGCRESGGTTASSCSRWGWCLGNSKERLPER